MNEWNQSINQSIKTHCIVPCVTSESEAHNGRDSAGWQCVHICCRAYKSLQATDYSVPQNFGKHQSQEVLPSGVDLIWSNSGAVGQLNKTQMCTCAVQWLVGLCLCLAITYDASFSNKHNTTLQQSHLIATGTRKEADIINVKWLHTQWTLTKTQTTNTTNHFSSIVVLMIIYQEF